MHQAVLKKKKTLKPKAWWTTKIAVTACVIFQIILFGGGSLEEENLSPSDLAFLRWTFIVGMVWYANYSQKSTQRTVSTAIYRYPFSAELHVDWLWFWIKPEFFYQLKGGLNNAWDSWFTVTRTLESCHQHRVGDWMNCCTVEVISKAWFSYS